ncbi:hypothetical protein FKB36_06475 [Methanoculleus sp. Afa-1]|uniref:FtsK domain-containing protein n=1 Tax=Methanoculleus formosensis TaxID=2590886 RepID=A0A9E4ZKQ2_9EURY|nr:DNA translocase FtsK [Methanoculleus sp. Afa-1]MCT8337147.1 hypothetical protein [Methanoculleus sp. Afa-1]
MSTPADETDSKIIQDIDAAWNIDIERSISDQLRRYLKTTLPVKDLRSQKNIRFENVGPGWQDRPCFAISWGYSNIRQNCPAVKEESELEHVIRVMSAYIRIDQLSGTYKALSSRGNHSSGLYTEQYIVAGQSPYFCKYLEAWKDPLEINPIQISDSTTICDAMKWWLLATICEETTDAVPYISLQKIKQRLQDLQKLNEIDDCPLWELIVGQNDRSMSDMHPESHQGKNAFYIIGYCSGLIFGEVHSYVVDPEYRKAFLATEKETGIDARTIMKCIGREWRRHCEKQNERYGVEIEALSSLLSLLKGNDRTLIKPDQPESTTLDTLIRDGIISKIHSGGYILSKGIGISTVQYRLTDIQREYSLEIAQWPQNTVLLRHTQEVTIKPGVYKEFRETLPGSQADISLKPSVGEYPHETLRGLQRSLLGVFSTSSQYQPVDVEYLSRLESHLQKIFEEFGIDCIVDYQNFDINGPRVIRANIKPGKGVTISSIERRSKDIANRLYSDSELFDFANEDEVPTDVYIENVAARGMIGIHIPRKNFVSVGIRDLLKDLPGKSQLEFPIGIDIAGNTRYSDLISMPHLLVAGHPGSGKSVFLNSFIISMLFQNSPAELKLQLIDPKGGLEFGAYEGLPDLYCDIVSDAKTALNVLEKITTEKKYRYEIFKKEMVKDISEYNELVGIDKKPFIVIVIDEFADLVEMSKGKEVMKVVQRLAQKGRAAGIHLVIATQKPSVKVIDGTIKSNLPARLSFRVATQSDSRVILDENGAEKLYGKGDCFLKEPNIPELRRFQAAYISNEEIKRFVTQLKSQQSA